MTTETLTETRPFEPTTPIKPSEAIRLGCLIAPVQATGEFFPSPGRACALGAMALGFGYDRDNHRHDTFGYSFITPFLPDELPMMNGEPGDAVDAIYVRNDSGWSRERIADWLEGLGL